MNNKLFAIVLMASLPIFVNAEEQAAKPAAQEHHMQNTDPSPKKAEPAPEHTMRNDDPSPKPQAPKPEHVMRNN